jgi:hypothetical protein
VGFHLYIRIWGTLLPKADNGVYSDASTGCQCLLLFIIGDGRDESALTMSILVSKYFVKVHNRTPTHLMRLFASRSQARQRHGRYQSWLSGLCEGDTDDQPPGVERQVHPCVPG